MKRWVIELPEDTPSQLTCDMQELTEDYIRENFKDIDKGGVEAGAQQAWEALAKVRSPSEWMKLYEYMGIKDFAELGSKYTALEGVTKINEFDRKKHWGSMCPICKYDIAHCQCLFGGSAHPDRETRKQAVKDHLQYLSETQVKHIIYLEANWQTSGTGEYQDVVDELKEMERFARMEEDDEQNN